MFIEDIIEKEAPAIANQIIAVANWAESETDLQIEVEKILESFKKQAHIDLKAHHNVTIGTGRPDSVYSLVIIEYKKPRRLGDSNSESGNQEVIAQLKQRFLDFEKKENKKRTQMFGMGTDGYKFIFVRFRANDWDIQDPLPVSEKTVALFLRRLSSLGTAGKALLPEHLQKDFGESSTIAKNSVQILYKKLSELKSKKSSKLFEQWQVMFKEVCGYDLITPERHIIELGSKYGISENIMPANLLFAIHSYYGIFMKLLAAEIVHFFHKMPSYIGKLSALSNNRLKSELMNLEEEGGIFRRMEIMNFFEGDLFGWYLYEWDEEIEGILRSIIDGLGQYDPATLIIEPQEARDLLKELYQYLIDRPVRHNLGEYYTPDWLAEVVLKESGYDGNPDKRVLDPSCGSGTFLIDAINKVRRFAENSMEPEKELLDKILMNIVGFDLNPLAVMAARVNYLMALGELLRYMKGEIEIPIYLCDSILIPQKFATVNREYNKIITSVGEFHIPISFITRKKVGSLVNILEYCVSKNIPSNDFLRILKSTLKLSEEEFEKNSELLKELYDKIYDLETSKINGIWARIIKNAFAPIYMGKFDFVLGNPPWVNWENLPKEYRASTDSFWGKYNLKAKAGSEQFELGKMKRDLAILFAYVCSDRYLKNGGVLGFVITQMVFKTPGAEVFRRFKLPNDEPLKVEKVHDMVDIKPFEDAANMTSVVILKKGKETTYPVPYIYWKKAEKGKIEGNLSLDEAMTRTVRYELVATPIDNRNKTSRWLTAKNTVIDALYKLIGNPAYRAYTGVYTGGVNGVYWVKILQKNPSGALLIENLHDVGKTKLEKKQAAIEADLVYPLIRSGDVTKWHVSTPNYITIPHTVKTDWKAIPEDELRVKYPKTYGYLYDFKDVLLKRAAYNLLRKGHPFYIMVDIHNYSFSPYKVVLNRMGNKIEAAVAGVKQDDRIGKKPAIPQETVTFIPFENEDEAHYLCAVLNFVGVDVLVKSFSERGGKSFATPSFLEHVNIQRYNSKNDLHKKLAELSKKAHKFASNNQVDKLNEIEDMISVTMKDLYGLKTKDLDEIKEQQKMFS